jgi:predicted RNase H-like HicB family nuclease
MSKLKSPTQRRSEREIKMTSYTFKVVLEKDKWPDEPESQAVWRAYIPELPSAHAWGDTPKEAMERLKDAVELLK